MHQLLPIIRRKRRPLIEPDAAPVAVVTPAPVVEPVAPVVVVEPTTPVVEPPKPEATENLKPKKARDDDAKN